MAENSDKSPLSLSNNSGDTDLVGIDSSVGLRNLSISTALKSFETPPTQSTQHQLLENNTAVRLSVPIPSIKQETTSIEISSTTTEPLQKETFDVLNVTTASSTVHSLKMTSSEPTSNDNTNTKLEPAKLKFFQENEILSSKDGHLVLEVGEEVENFEIIRRLGVGSYAAVWLAKNKTDCQKVALKIAKLMPNGRSCYGNELEMIKHISCVTERDAEAGKNIVSFLDSFTVRAPNLAEHLVMVFDICGPDLFTIIENSNQKKLGFKRIQDFGHQLLTGINFLHSNCNVLHCDLKPENIMIVLKNKNVQVLLEASDPETTRLSFDIDLLSDRCDVILKIGDFGFGMKLDATKTMLVQTCVYRAPENFLNAKSTTSIDMWSFGCIMYYMATQHDLFECDEECDTVLGEAETHLGQIFCVLGKPNLDVYEGRQKSSEINKLVESGQLFTPESLREPASSCLTNKLKEFSSLSTEATKLLSDLLLQILQLDPKARLSADEALKHCFFAYEEVDGLTEEQLRELNQCFDTCQMNHSSSDVNGDSLDDDGSINFGLPPRSLSPCSENDSPTYQPSSPYEDFVSPNRSVSLQRYYNVQQGYEAVSPSYDAVSPNYRTASPTYDAATTSCASGMPTSPEKEENGEDQN